MVVLSECLSCSLRLASSSQQRWKKLPGPQWHTGMPTSPNTPVSTYSWIKKFILFFTFQHHRKFQWETHWRFFLKKEVKNIYIWSDCNRWPTHIQFKLCGKSGANQHVFSPKLQKDKQRQHSKLIWQVSNNYRQDTMVCPAVSEWKENKPWKEVFSYAMWYLDSSAFPIWSFL